MPAFELSILMRTLPRDEAFSALKRIGTLLLEKGAILQKLENHGTKDLPYRMRKESHIHTKGSYFVYSLTGSPNIFEEVKEVCNRDLDVICHRFMPVPKPLTQACTLDEEMLPPAKRKSVLALMEKGRKYKEKSKPVYRHVKNYNYFDVYM